MLNYFSALNSTYLALIGGMFSFFFTSLGASIVFLFKKNNDFIMNSMVSIAAGIMLAASYFSLLKPAIDISNTLHYNTCFIVGFGFILGGLLLYLISKVIIFMSKKNNNKSNIRKCLLLMISITLHNIPEGLVIGVAFGAISLSINNMTLIGAITITLGIAIQNFPEGAAISLPLKKEGYSSLKSFILGALSGIVEPLFAIIGAILVIKINNLLPFVLSVAAGAMIFVTVLELIPESQSNNKKDLMALFTLIGFIIMMTLEILLG